tara:strand:- start:13245 stop:13751 length:507 start_codon:yes stop_codon:yes gene_type:complete
MAENKSILNPALKQAAATSSSMVLTFHEIFTKVNNAKDKQRKIEVLRQYDSPSMRQVLKGAFDPKIKWDLPEGTPPYIENEAPLGTEHTYLDQEAKRLWHFVVGADLNLTKVKKETLFIQMLEGLSADEAKLLIGVKDKNLNNIYKGLTSAVIREAFGWNDDFVKIET